jgi:Protein of unknown function (DUF3592)
MENSSSIPGLIFVFIILIAACAYAVIKCIQELLTYIRIKKSGHLVKGEIIDFNEQNSDGDVFYPAVVSYTTIHGQKITATSRTASSVKPSIGKEVWVFYSPSDPSHFYFHKSHIPYISTLAIISFGTGIILLSLELFKIV